MSEHNEVNVTSEFELGKISINYAEIEANIRSQVEHFQNVVVTEESLVEFGKIKAEINKVIKDLSDKRIKIKKAWNTPVDVMELEIKRISKIAEDASANIDRQLKEFEEKRVSQLKAELFKQHEDYKVFHPSVDWLPFENILKSEWLTKTNARKAPDLLETELARIESDVLFIEGIEDKAEEVLTLEAYKKCLNAVTAQSEARATLLQVRRAETLRKENIAQNEQKQAVESVSIQPEEYFGDAKIEKKPEAYTIAFADIIDFTKATEVLMANKVPFKIV